MDEWEMDLVMEQCAVVYPNIIHVPDAKCRKCKVFNKPKGCEGPVRV
jgi:hypothetical protein